MITIVFTWRVRIGRTARYNLGWNRQRFLVAPLPTFSSGVLRRGTTTEML